MVYPLVGKNAMSNDNGRPNRRNVLRMTGLGIAGLVATGSASARPGKGQRGPPDHANAPDHAGPPILKRNGRYISVAVDREDWGQADASDVEGVPDDAEKVPYDALVEFVKRNNEAIRAGHQSIEPSDNPSGFRFGGDA